MSPGLLLTKCYSTYQGTQKYRSKRHDAYEASSGEIKAFAQEKREAETFSSVWDDIKAFSIKEFRLHMINGFLL